MIALKVVLIRDIITVTISSDLSTTFDASVNDEQNPWWNQCKYFLSFKYFIIAWQYIFVFLITWRRTLTASHKYFICGQK